MEIRKVCESSSNASLSISMRCSEGHTVNLKTVVYLRGSSHNICLDDGIASSSVCRITDDRMLKKMGTACHCKRECRVTAEVTNRHRTACRNAGGDNNIHVQYTCVPGNLVHNCPGSANVTSIPSMAIPVTQAEHPYTRSTSPKDYQGKTNMKNYAMALQTDQPPAKSTVHTTASDIPDESSTPTSLGNTVPAGLIAGATLAAVLALALIILFIVLAIKFCRQKGTKERDSLSRLKPTFPHHVRDISFVHIEHESNPLDGGATIIRNLQQINPELERIKYGSLQRKYIGLNTLVPPGGKDENSLPDVVINKENTINTSCEVCKKEESNISQNNSKSESPVYAVLNKNEIRSSTSSAGSDEPACSRSHNCYSKVDPTKFLWTLPDKEVVHEQHRGELPTPPSYTNDELTHNESSSVLGYDNAGYEGDYDEIPADSVSSSINHGSKSRTRQDSSHTGPSGPSQASLQRESGTLIVDNPIYNISNRISQTSI